MAARRCSTRSGPGTAARCPVAAAARSPRRVGSLAVGELPGRSSSAPGSQRWSTAHWKRARGPGAALGDAHHLAPADQHLAGAEPGEAHQVGPAGAHQRAVVDRGARVARAPSSTRAQAATEPGERAGPRRRPSAGRWRAGRRRSRWPRPGARCTAPPPLRRRATSMPAAAAAAPSTTSSRWVLPSTTAGRVTSNHHSSWRGRLGNRLLVERGRRALLVDHRPSGQGHGAGLTG